MIKNASILVRNRILGLTYRFIFKPVFFRRDPEIVHDRMLSLGEKTSRTPFLKQSIKLLFGYSNRYLHQTVDGVEYPNPIGLAAGFDKNAQITTLTPLIGFGFEEIGSITGEQCDGNDKPRLWRLPKSKSLVVYYGLMNDGAKAIAKRLKGQNFKIPIGVSVAKTNSPKTATMEAGVKDYVKAYALMKDVGQYVTINISCPNAYGGQPFTDKKSLESLLEAISQVRINKPHYIKLSPDISLKQVDDIINLARKYQINGFISSNLVKDRKRVKIIDDEIPATGGLSGKVVEGPSNELLTYLRKKTKDEFTLIGCGGVFTAEDAYNKILNGATLIQLITGMIYGGPQQISEINRGLVRLLKRDGYKSIKEAVGKAVD